MGGVCWEVNLVCVPCCFLRADRRRVPCLIRWFFYPVLPAAVSSLSRLIPCSYVCPPYLEVVLKALRGSPRT